MTLQFDIMINVEPRHGVAHDMSFMLLNNLLQRLIALSQKITSEAGFVLKCEQISLKNENEPPFFAFA